MEYITTGDRIAVENFEIGSIYKVTFLNETEVYFMCCGKGKDFVMLMSNEPRLFSLTMSSAAEVVAIEDYTPLPPPTPPTNLLQYQTGEPPFSFTTTDTELFSWYIKGPAGEKTANLWNGEYEYCYVAASTGIFYSPDNTTISAIIPIDSNTTYSIEKKYKDGVGYGNRLTVAEFTEYPVNGATGNVLFAEAGAIRCTITTSNNVAYLVIFTLYTSAPSPMNLMINKGSTILPYEPPNMYKIPILCNTTTSIIYIEEALGENDVLYSTDTTYKIATELGENLLQVQGETQPSEMQIVYKWVFEYE